MDSLAAFKVFAPILRSFSNPGHVHRDFPGVCVDKTNIEKLTEMF